MNEYFARGLAELGIELDPERAAQELSFQDELLRWNHRINLTSITDGNEATEKHLIDSLVVLKYLDGVVTLLDMGSGGGLPGIPLAIASPHLKVTSVDSVGKKINFQKHIKRQLELNNLRVEHVRVENLGRANVEKNSFDCVVSRAFSSLRAILEYSSSWVKPGGVVIAMKGPEGLAEIDDVQPLLQQYGFGSIARHKYTLPYSKAERYLFMTSKCESVG